MTVPEEGRAAEDTATTGSDEEARETLRSGAGREEAEPAVTRREDDPGADAGAENPPGDRIVRGTASAAEGYAHTDEGTAAAEPLKGVQREEEPPGEH